MSKVQQIESSFVSDPEIFGGKPIVRGTRVSVSLIVDWINSGVTVNQILDDFPNLVREDVEAAVAFVDREKAQTLTGPE